MKQYKLFARRLVLFFLVLLSFLAIYFLICNQFSRVENMTIWVNDTFLFKDNIAKRMESPKVIVLGGSNVLFGISAKMIEEELNMPAVNYGLHAGLGDYIFERTKKIAKPGDVILMPLEYEFYWSEKKLMFARETIEERYILTHDYEYYQRLPILGKLNMMFVNAMDLQMNIEHQDKKVIEYYNVSTLNQWGDETNNSYELKKDHLDKLKPFAFPADFTERFPSYYGAREIVSFAQWARKNNVTLIASYPSTIYFDVYNSKRYVNDFELIEEFYTEHNITMLGSPNDFFYDVDLFYDTEYHLNDRGTKKRTKFIIDELKKLFQERNLI